MYFISRLLMFRQFLTASTRFERLYEAIRPESIEAFETHVIEVEGVSGANMGRIIIGSTVGIEALGSP